MPPSNTPVTPTIPPASEGHSVSSPPSSGLPILLVIAVVVIAIAALAAGGYMLLGPQMMGAPMTQSDAPVEIQQTSGAPVSENDALETELNSFSTADLDAELSQIERELAE
jgi:hypothetical protein